MSDFQLNSVTTPQPISHVPAVEPPKPPKAQSDHKPVNAAAGAHGPAVVLSGAVAKPPERHGQNASVEVKATGQHLNHVI